MNTHYDNRKISKLKRAKITVDKFNVETCILRDVALLFKHMEYVTKEEFAAYLKGKSDKMIDKMITLNENLILMGVESGELKEKIGVVEESLQKALQSINDE